MTNTKARNTKKFGNRPAGFEPAAFYPENGIALLPIWALGGDLYPVSRDFWGRSSGVGGTNLFK